MSGSRSNVAASISTPVESSRPVAGHLTMTTLVLIIINPSSAERPLHLFLFAPLSHFIPVAISHPAIGLGLCGLHISREGWTCEGKLRVTARIEIKVFMAASPLRWNLAHD